MWMPLLRARSNSAPTAQPKENGQLPIYQWKLRITYLGARRRPQML